MMTQFSFFTLTLLLAIAAHQLPAQTCSPTGNVVIYSNYDGGIININCNLNISNLKIGVCTYENVEINITGPFAGNVTEVIYAGYEGDNDNCNQGVNSTTISGVPVNITSILFAPPATLADPDGYGSIICGYSCGDGSQGGCNTAAQVVDYFMDQFGGTLRTFHTQYGCWEGDVFNTGDSDCCGLPQPELNTYFTVSDPIVCLGQCINFSDMTAGANDWDWTFEGAAISNSGQENPTNICYTTLGAQTATLTASDGNLSGTYSVQIQVLDCGLSGGTPGCTYPNAINYDPDANTDDGSCFYYPCSDSCPGDLNEDGIVSVSDLIIFIALYGLPCPE
ncbi:MAG: hypothetical protein ACKVOR_10965 [Flavobacteriales bacterium]